MSAEEYIGEAYATDKQIVIAVANGRSLDENHNCDQMGCGQWHVLFRIPKSYFTQRSEER